ncbi:hypothetical protein B1772_03530 [Dehalococcoides mccartyi]|nr:hypothetical protein B1776_03220 [Dehalococcoides mccartyi]AQY73154.1 hypothetical protein B1772_03530 [Dehalococcoides mccartyi]
MGDPNGNFVHDFQGTGFYARVFELCSYAYLESNNFEIDRRHERPDFLVSHGIQRAAVECVTSNPTEGSETDIIASFVKPLSEKEMLEKVMNEFPIRMASILKKKLEKKYWELPHCQGLPFVLMVEPFHEPGSQYYIDDSFARYLYGGSDIHPQLLGPDGFPLVVPIRRHEYKGKSVKSGFFQSNNSEMISAVLYCNQFSVSKFLRLAIQEGIELGIQGQRWGFIESPGQNENIEIDEYEYTIGDPSSPLETWGQGVTIFHNPNAKNPIPESYFNTTSIYEQRDGDLVRNVIEYHPLISFTTFYPRT